MLYSAVFHAYERHVLSQERNGNPSDVSTVLSDKKSEYALSEVPHISHSQTSQTYDNARKVKGNIGPPNQY